MNKPNHDNLEDEVLKKSGKREKKGKPKMVVSGQGVKVLQRIIKDKVK
jgi:hypothetical protein